MPYVNSKEGGRIGHLEMGHKNKPLTVGRGEGVEVSLDDKEVSHKQCVIVPNDTGYSTYVREISRKRKA